MFQIRIKHTGKEAVWVVPPKISIGSANDNDLVLKNPGVQAHHLELRVENDSIFLHTANSANELFINETKAAQDSELHVGDVIRINNTELELLLPNQNIQPSEAITLDSNADKWFLEALNGNHKGKRYKLKKSTLLGRSEQCDMQLQDDKISRQHARLDIIGGALKITDMGSANGCYVNNNKITSSYARAEDQLKLGDNEFKIIGPFLDSNRTTVTTAVSNAQNLAPKAATDIKTAPSLLPDKTNKTAKPDTEINTTKHRVTTKKTRWFIIAASCLVTTGLVMFFIFQK